MAKLDKIKFAQLIAFICSRTACYLDSHDLSEIDNIVYVELPDPSKASANDVDELLKQILLPDGFIPAIKAYRVITGVGLKEAKEAIERYRSVKAA